MKTISDVIVVGAGPVGSFAAMNLARLGVNTTVFEEHADIGVPVHCAGHLSIRSLRSLGLFPLPDKIVENVFSAANFYSPNGTKLSVQLKKPVTCTVNRELFDKLLAERAIKAGAKFRLSTRVRSIVLDKGILTAVTVSHEGVESTLPARLVVDAEGISSRLFRQAGLARSKNERLVYSVEAEMDNVDNIEEDAVEVFTGNSYAPGFYAWIIPRSDGTAKVGLATRAGSPKKYLQRLIEDHPIASRQLRRAGIRQTSFHTITLGGPVSKAFMNGFIAVGDAASQVKPTTGGGVIFGLSCARIAAETISVAIEKDDLTSDFLSLYQKRFMEVFGFDFNVMLRIRRFLDAVSDERLNAAFRFCNKVGLGEALSEVDEIDFQGRTLFGLLNKPAALSALAYFLVLYFAVNP